MRAIWSGSIAFGLVNVPVKAYGATEDHDVDLHQVHDADGGRIRYLRKCEKCGKKVPYEHIDKGFDDGERTVVLSDVEMEALPAEKSREIDVIQFVPNDQIDPIMLERSYYLAPDSKSPKAYALLRQTLKETELTAVVKFALRQKTRLGILRVRGDVMLLQGMLWADEVREADFASARAAGKISPQEMKMSAALVRQFTTDFTPEAFEDEYQVQLRTLISEKLQRGDGLDTEATFGASDTSDNGEKGEVIDLMEALKRSIATKRTPSTPAAGQAAGGKGGSGSESAQPGAEKKQADKKQAPAKKKTPTTGNASDTKAARKKTRKGA
ncbi:non-homologous end joining protein Ku [Paeniglutamicibacter psychrophenolicus]|uniref:non-homologous end joining protein Ku n=1 Tax=Paeniglutamicibacter psychrophenolicus TaxID=257454 RepID=UPI002784D6C6|nr:Ku protein [Paeniglutamicibacter psychrophenolicus]MDQ0095989.1 DNA end-binding protein Ku [Paeniglutamicibacter psychrophenolicus]